jgi:hypothetical protein
MERGDIRTATGTDDHSEEYAASDKSHAIRNDGAKVKDDVFR